MKKKGTSKEIKKVGAKKVTDVDKVKESLQIDAVDALDSIGKVGGVGAISKRRPTRTMSSKERDEFFKVIDEEAKKLFSNSDLSPEHKALVKDAVKMVVDSTLLDEEPDGDS